MNAVTKRRVLFLGTHGQFNVGDELLLETFLAQLGTEHHYAVNSYAPTETAAQLDDAYDVDVFDTASTRLGLVARIRRADTVVFGGGSIVKELYASTGRWRYATLCMVLAIVVTARLLRTPVLMSNIGVGPITHRPGRLLARAILRTAARVSVRDQQSLDTCHELGCRSARLVPDAVWVNERGDLVASERTAPDTADRRAPLRLALNINRDIENAAQWEPFVDLLAQALREVAADRPVEVHGLPMQCRFKDHTDLDELDALFATLDGTPGLSTVRHKPSDHRDVAEVIEMCDVVVSERLHAIVMAATLHRAVVALPYDVKVRQLVEQLGLTERSFDVNHPFCPSQLAATMLATADRSVAEGRRLATRAEERRSAAAEYFDDVRAWLQRPDRTRWSNLAPG